MPDWQEHYPYVYRSLSPAYRELPRSQVEQVLRGVLGESSDLDSVEGFFDDIGRTLSGIGHAVGNAAQQAAPVLAKVAPGVLSGALSGAPLGLPGIIGGAVLGGLGSAGIGQPAAPQPMASGPAAAGTSASPVSGGLPVQGGLGTGPTGVAGQLLAALGSPTVQQALLSMLLGPAGNRSVPTAGGSQVPVAAITNLLGVLANRASAEWESIAPFGEMESSREGVDSANPEARAAWLYNQLQPGFELGLPRQTEMPDESWIDDMYDELEARFYAEDDA